MKFKLPNNTYYQNHLKTIERYISSGNYLHIIGNHNTYFKQSKNTHIVSVSENLNRQLNIDEKFETIVFTDFFESSEDIYSLLLESKSILRPQGKLVISVINYKFSFLIKLFEGLGLKKKSPRLSHINENHIRNLAQTTGLEFITSHTKQILPFKFFGILTLINEFLELLFGKLNLGIIRYIVFKNNEIESNSKSKKTVIIPAKNEEGNIPILFDELNRLDIDEVIFSVGNSKDNTEKTIKEYMKKYENLNVLFHKQSKNGKANAIWESFPYVSGDIIAILDSDLSVEPKELKKFYSIIENNYADFVNGSRLIYPMEKESMRKINFLGNRIFQFVVTFITGTKLSDSLCGTKVFKKGFINKIDWWQNKYKLFDPFCDFDLLFTAAIVGEKIVEYPIHYKSRIYGKTQISRFRDGFKLIVYLIKSFRIFHSSRK
tara:strand:- start:3618 stop:4916 length:1299 start_codon:yes stop_codon:yes gene_type:complete